MLFRLSLLFVIFERMSNSEFIIYQADNGKTEISVRFENNNLWINQYQLEELFQTDRTSILRHITNIYKTNELDKNSTCAKIAQVQMEGNRQIVRKINSYNLDVIIAVGYRVNSKRGTQFRIWANQILKDHLIKGFTLNEKKLKQQNELLKELQNSIKILGNILNEKPLSNEEGIGLLQIISDYARALEILDQYDYKKLQIKDTSKKETNKISYKEAIEQIELVKKSHSNSNLFGQEKDKSFESSIAAIYQTFDGVELYPSIEEKAANLLYFITKNHSFSDGNKRIAAFMFLYFMNKNGILYVENKMKRIADNTLVALTLMIAVSKPEEKETIIKVIVNLINKNN